MVSGGESLGEIHLKEVSIEYQVDGLRDKIAVLRLADVGDGTKT
jgi:hypothetical protein